jgi:ATPase subunit of ABC transporter with duplicated ATPase domains
MSVVLSDLSFTFPNGRVVLIHLSASFHAGRTGLIGQNGSGKSTLLRLIAGALRPTSGSVTATGEIGYLPQDLTLDTSATVASLLGIAAARDAIRAIEAGSVDPAAFDAVGDDWDIEDRAREQLARLGLSRIGLDDPVGRLSGGALRLYGGNLEAYELMLATEQAAAQRAVSAAEADVRREKRDLLETQVKQARRDRMGRQLAASGSIPRIVAGGRKRAAEVSAGKGREVALARIADAKDRLADAEDALRVDTAIRISLPGTAVPAGRTVVTVQGLDAPWAPWHANPDRPGGNGSNAHRDDAGDGDDGPGRRPGHHPGRAAQRGGRVPAAAAQHPRRRAERGGQRAGGRSPRERGRRPGRAGEVPAPRRAGRPARGRLADAGPPARPGPGPQG